MLFGKRRCRCSLFFASPDNTACLTGTCVRLMSWLLTNQRPGELSNLSSSLVHNCFLTWFLSSCTDTPVRLPKWNSSSEPLTSGTDAPEWLPQWNSSSEHLTLGTDVPGRLSQSNSSREHLTVGRKGLNVPRVPSTRSKLISWFKERRRSGSTHKWGSHLPRMVVTLHLVNDSIFSPGNWPGIGQEISYKLTFQLLHRLSK
ncbi:uncharacterized protein TNIN_316961 [Trichonephila inaurata madagascariensis]|uniref:Uncharacterized protein n=1 Tax=Trichonephila inaurata madagascariensis TaxID=2747483 RepID=A0A8X7BYB9_9ARAC|nr:uncharacterized protein TNIN_316961 [Trichonephila inaurata madagascariensis]